MSHKILSSDCMSGPVIRYNDRGYAYSYVTSFEGLDRGKVVANINESKASADCNAYAVLFHVVSAGAAPCC